MTTETEQTQTIYYWHSGLWVDDKSSADLAITLLGFDEYETLSLAHDKNNADIEQAVAESISAAI